MRVGQPTTCPAPSAALCSTWTGTLLDTEPAYRRAFYAALTEAGHTLPAGAYDQLVGLPSTTRRKLLPEILGPGFDAGLFFHSYYRHRSLLSAGGVAIKAGAVRGCSTNLPRRASPAPSPPPPAQPPPPPN